MKLTYDFYNETKQILEKIEKSKWSREELESLILTQEHYISIYSEYSILLKNLKKLKTIDYSNEAEIKKVLYQNIRHIENIEKNQQFELHLFQTIKLLLSIKTLTILTTILSGAIVFSYLNGIHAINLFKDFLNLPHLISISIIVFIGVFIPIIILFLIYGSIYLISNDIYHKAQQKTQESKLIKFVREAKYTKHIYARLTSEEIIRTFRTILFLGISLVLTYFTIKILGMFYIVITASLPLALISCSCIFIAIIIDFITFNRRRNRNYNSEKVVLSLSLILITISFLTIPFSKSDTSSTMEKIGFKDNQNQIYLIDKNFYKTLPTETKNIHTKIKDAENLFKESIASCGRLEWSVGDTLVFQPNNSPTKHYQIPKDKITLLQRDDIYEECK